MGSTPSKAVQSESRDAEKTGYTTRELSQSLNNLHISAPLSSDGALTLGNINAWEGVVEQSSKLQLSRTILNHTDIRQSLLSRSAFIADAHVFNTELDFKTGPITNQKSSGRCWLFATTNVLRYNIMKKLNLSEFQLSQVHLMSQDYSNSCT